MIPSGRVIRAGELNDEPRKVGPSARPSPRGRVLRPEDVAASEEAHRIVAAAKQRADALIAEAVEGAERLRVDARREGREQAALELTVSLLRLRREEATQGERQLDRIVLLARALAERLLGEALRVDPSRITAIARQVLAQVRKAATVEVFAHPDDAAALSREIGALGLEATVLEVHVDPERARGSLKVCTDLATLDADLTLQLDRLAVALRDTFRA